MKNLVFVTYFLFLFTTKINAGIFGGNHGLNITNTFDGGYAACGLNGSDLYVVNIDSTGSIIWSKTMYYPHGAAHSYSSAYSIIQTNDSGFVMTGTIYAAITQFDSAQHVAIIKLDKFGDSLWTKSYIINELSEGITVNENLNNDLIISVSSQEQLYHRPGYILRLDSSGNFIGQSFLSYAVWASPLVNTPTGEYFGVFQFSESNGFSYTSTDQNGSVYWTSSLWDSTLNYNYYANGYCNADSGFFIAGQWNFQFQPNKFLLIKLDFNGNFLWQKQTNMDLRLYRISEFQDGFVGIDTGLVFYRFNTLGDTLWSKQMFRGGYTFKSTPTGGFVFVGDSANQVWVSITDSAGNQLRFGSVSLLTEAIPSFISNLVIFPNPSYGNLTISLTTKNSESCSVEIVDENGKLLKRINDFTILPGKNDYSINLTGDLNHSGNYFLRLIEGEKLTRTEKFVFIK